MKNGKFITRKHLVDCDIHQLRELYFNISGEKLSNKIEVNEAIEVIVMKCTILWGGN